MPWVDSSKCVGCGICEINCPVDAISMGDKKAFINMNRCIRCGTCHNICPVEAVRHDSEKIPDNVKYNIEITKKYMDDCAKYLGNIEERKKCLNRMKKHFNKEKIVAEKTLEELEKMH